MKRYYNLVWALSLVLLIVSCSEETIPINHDLDNTMWVRVDDPIDEKIYYIEKLIFENGYVHEAHFDTSEDSLLRILNRYEYTYDKREGRILYFHSSGKYIGGFQIRGNGTILFYGNKTYELKDLYSGPL